MCSNSKAVRFGILMLLLTGLAPKASADVTVLLEEPYSYDGALAGNGHTAVYLSRVCAQTPIILRSCGPGERGVVISRYTRVGGYDWIAIPLIPYLYAVEKPAEVPLLADREVVALLRDQYRRGHLEDIVPDGPSGVTPKGDWIQLVGSSYDRTSYGFQLETTAEQDDALIAWLNSRPNRASYQFIARNCANFVRDVVNFYYPKAVSRGFITDLAVSTPKHDAKSLVKYSQHHPDILFSRIVFPQVPGDIRRSRPVRGVLESAFRAKKYMVPLALFHPMVAGGVASVYLVGDRFNPARGGMVFSLTGAPAAPSTNDERKTYSEKLKAVMAQSDKEIAGTGGVSWRQFQEKAHFQLDETGRPVLRATVGDQVIEMGITRDDIARKDVPAAIQRGFLEARLRQQLTRGRAPKISSDELHDDWQLLQEIGRSEQEKASRPAEIDRANPGLESNSD